MRGNVQHERSVTEEPTTEGRDCLTRVDTDLVAGGGHVFGVGAAVGGWGDNYRRTGVSHATSDCIR